MACVLQVQLGKRQKRENPSKQTDKKNLLIGQIFSQSFSKQFQASSSCLTLIITKPATASTSYPVKDADSYMKIWGFSTSFGGFQPWNLSHPVWKRFPLFGEVVGKQKARLASLAHSLCTQSWRIIIFPVCYSSLQAVIFLPTWSFLHSFLFSPLSDPPPLITAAFVHSSSSSGGMFRTKLCPLYLRIWLPIMAASQNTQIQLVKTMSGINVILSLGLLQCDDTCSCSHGKMTRRCRERQQREHNHQQTHSVWDVCTHDKRRCMSSLWIFCI